VTVTDISNCGAAMAADVRVSCSAIDVVFIMDVTGSTGSLLPQWQAANARRCRRHSKQLSERPVRSGITSRLPVRDHSDVNEYAYHRESPSDNTGALLSALKRPQQRLGSDEPESQYEAIYRLLLVKVVTSPATGLHRSWRDRSVTHAGSVTAARS